MCEPAAASAPHVLPVAKPWLGEEEVQAAGRAILSGWVTQGPEVAAFEREFASRVGAEHACAVSSCTTALHLALRAIGVGPGDEVITVSHSFIATANAVRYCGAIPVFVDIDPAMFNMDPALIERAITSRTRAILCVHQMGMPCDLNAIVPLARAHGLPVVEDAACAIGSEILVGGDLAGAACSRDSIPAVGSGIQGDGRWQPIGRPHGDIACFSFHPRKLVTTGDGGMLTTANPEWDRQFRLWRQHGMSMPDLARHQATAISFESYLTVGYNYRMTDIQAAVGREQLKRLPEMVRRRRRFARLYADLLAEAPAITAPEEPAWARSNFQSYCARLPRECDQRAVMQHMLDQGISTRRGIMCSHREPACSDLDLRFALPESERACDRCILLPMHHDLTDEQVARVVRELREACGL